MDDITTLPTMANCSCDDAFQLFESRIVGRVSVLEAPASGTRSHKSEPMISPSPKVIIQNGLAGFPSYIPHDSFYIERRASYGPHHETVDVSRCTLSMENQ